MNAQLEGFARQTIKDGLAKCTAEQNQTFRNMYDCSILSRATILVERDFNPDTHEERPISEVVDAMSVDALDHAMTQIKRSIDNNVSKGELV